MKYRVEITETLQRIISIEADSKEEAEQRVILMYRQCEIVLSSSDFVDTDIKVLDND